MLKKKQLIIFMPSIEVGGVEKNLFLISNYLSTKIRGIKLITANKKDKKFFKKIQLISPKSEFWQSKSRFQKYLICLFLLVKILVQNRNTVVFAFQANLYCTIICKIFNVKVIIRSNTSPIGWSKNIIKKYLYKKILSCADKIIVNSLDFKNQFKTIFSIKVECIYNPLDKEYIQKKSKEKLFLPFFKKQKCLKLINVARLTEQKDHLTLLKALYLIKNKLDFRMLILGEGPYKNQLVNFINTHNLNKKVKIINFKKNPFKFIKSSNIFVLTSKFEGLPNVLLEAITLKKFIISTNCPTGPKEILANGKGGDLVKIGDYKSISRSIYAYSKNKKKINKKIIYSYKSLIKFDMQENLEKYFYIIFNYITNKDS